MVCDMLQFLLNWPSSVRKRVHGQCRNHKMLLLPKVTGIWWDWFIHGLIGHRSVPNKNERNPGLLVQDGHRRSKFGINFLRKRHIFLVVFKFARELPDGMLQGGGCKADITASRPVEAAFSVGFWLLSYDCSNCLTSFVRNVEKCRPAIFSPQQACKWK